MPSLKPEVKQHTVPSDPVGATRQAQQPLENPKTPLVKPEDTASRIKELVKPKTNKILGTDKPKKKKYKPANTANTNTPSYLNPPREVPEAKVASLMKFLNWYKENNLDTQISKMSLPSIAGVGLGWFLSDNLTRDEKQRTERNLEREWEKALERSELAQKNKSTKPKSKTAFQKLNDFYKNFNKGA